MIMIMMTMMIIIVVVVIIITIIIIIVTVVVATIIIIIIIVIIIVIVAIVIMLHCKLGLQCGDRDLQGGWGGQTHGRAGCKGVLKGLQQYWSQLHSQQSLTNLYISSIEILLDSMLQLCSVHSIHEHDDDSTYKHNVTTC